MNARRLSRIVSRPFHSATPSRQVASFARQSKPFPKVLSSISFQKASSHSGGAVLVMVSVVIVVSRTDVKSRGDAADGVDTLAPHRQADMEGRPRGDRQLSLGSCQTGIVVLRLRFGPSGR